MGIFVNPDYDNFLSYADDKYYIDKSLIINNTNDVINTNSKFICMVRPRRFGKSLSATLLNAYYNKSFNSKEIFDKYKISKTQDYLTHLNKYNVIYIDFHEVVDIYDCNNKDENVNMVKFLKNYIVNELKTEFGDIISYDDESLLVILQRLKDKTGDKFVFIIDEWDMIFREDKYANLEDDYLKLLRSLFKGKSGSGAIALTYITGILPILSDKTQSALNNFSEFSLVNPGRYFDLFGFTEQDMVLLCEKSGMDLQKMELWYDGYRFNGEKLYNPFSVIQAIAHTNYVNYWEASANYITVFDYIKLKIKELRKNINLLLAGQSIETHLTKVTNINNLSSKEEIFTILTYFGYLNFDQETSTINIPNKEVAEEFEKAVRKSEWNEILSLLNSSKKLLEYTLKRDEETVSSLIFDAHKENSSIFNYNDENALACVISLAYYSAKEHYKIFREQPSGIGYADMVFIPRPTSSNKLPMVVELKWDVNVETAIKQIKQKYYTDSIKKMGLPKFKKCLLVGISYDKEDKKHTTKIEEVEL